MLENDQLFCYLMVSNLTKRRPKEKNKEKKKMKTKKKCRSFNFPILPNPFLFSKTRKINSYKNF